MPKANPLSYRRLHRLDHRLDPGWRCISDFVCFVSLWFSLCICLFCFVSNFQVFSALCFHLWSAVCFNRGLYAQRGLAILCVCIRQTLQKLAACYHMLPYVTNVHVWRGDGDTKTKRSWPRPHPNVWFHFVCIMSYIWISWIAWHLSCFDFNGPFWIAGWTWNSARES